MKDTKSRPLRNPRRIDWPDIHRRLEAAREASERGWAPSPAESKTILRTRAQALAQVRQEDGAIAPRIEVVEFMLAYENYGIESSFVREVYPLTDLTPLPCTPSFVRGIVNVRGEIVSVIDLKQFFELPMQGLTDHNKVIILHSDRMMFGILADLIVGVRDLTLADIQPSLPTLIGIREAYLLGVTKERIVVLDAAKLLSDGRIVVHETVEI